MFSLHSGVLRGKRSAGAEQSLRPLAFASTRMRLSAVPVEWSAGERWVAPLGKGIVRVGKAMPLGPVIRCLFKQGQSHSQLRNRLRMRDFCNLVWVPAARL